MAVAMCCLTEGRTHVVGRSNVPSSIHFYQDQVLAGGQSEALMAGRRIVYCRFGEVTLNGERLGVDEARYVGEDLILEGFDAWSQIWRWEVDLPNAEKALLRGEGILSLHQMSRVIGMLDMAPGTEWLFRLDQITAPPGRVTDPHRHPGPGIRCMVEGTFNVHQDVESVRAVSPGQSWWECGEQPVIAWGSKTMHARFLRGLVLPAEHLGQVDTIRDRRSEPNRKRGKFRLLVDQIITAPSGDW